MSAVATVERPRPPTVDLVRLRALTSDPTPWGLPEIQGEMGWASRHAVLKLWRGTCNYLYGAADEWPPAGVVLNKRLYDDGAAARELWWPPHVSLLPPPDFPGVRPRWRAGTIRTWAMQVGRMALDGTPQTVGARGRVHAGVVERPDVTAVDLVRLRLLIAKDELWTIRDIQQFFGVSESNALHWYRATRNRMSRKVDTWPPERDERRKITQGRGQNLTWWPPCPTLLPPPSRLDEKGKPRFYGDEKNRWWGGVRYLWRAGDILHWGLMTGRLRPDGTVVRRLDDGVSTRPSV